MTSAVLDASAVLALVRDEPSGDKVAEHVGRGAISAVNLQEVVKELSLSGLPEPVIRELLGELRLDVRPHDADAAYAAALEAGEVRQTAAHQRELIRTWLTAILEAEGVTVSLPDPTDFSAWDPERRRLA